MERNPSAEMEAVILGIKLKSQLPPLPPVASTEATAPSPTPKAKAASKPSRNREQFPSQLPEKRSLTEHRHASLLLPIEKEVVRLREVGMAWAKIASTTGIKPAEAKRLYSKSLLTLSKGYREGDY